MSLEEAEAADPGFTLGWVLHHAVCPIALLTGDLAIADRGVATMKDVATRLDAALWRSSGVTGKARRSSSVPSSYEDPPSANSTRYMRSNWLAYLQCRVPWRFGARTSRACAARCGARHHRESPGDRRPARLTGLWNSSSPMPMLMMLLEFSATLSPIHAPINSFAAEGRRVLGDRSILNASPVPLPSTGVTACWGR